MTTSSPYLNTVKDKNLIKLISWWPEVPSGFPSGGDKLSKGPKIHPSQMEKSADLTHHFLKVLYNNFITYFIFLNKNFDILLLGAQIFSGPKVTPLQNRKNIQIWPTIFGKCIAELRQLSHEIFWRFCLILCYLMCLSQIWCKNMLKVTLKP